MNNSFFEIPVPINEPIKDYRADSIERKELVNSQLYEKKIQLTYLCTLEIKKLRLKIK